MDKNIGFIGCGNMAQAIIGGILYKGIVNADKIIASNRSKEKLDIFSNKYGIRKAENNIAVAMNSNILFLAVKPNMYVHIMEEIKEYIKKDTIMVSIAAGINIDLMEKTLGKDYKIVRSMPNTPALVGEGMSALTFNSKLDKNDKEEIISIFQSFGKVEIIEEKLMNVVPAISGSSPAYVYMFIEALADGGVLSGMPREQAYKMAAQAVLGAAKMVLETGEHPGKLKDNVCSPGGTTIEAVYSLEKNNFRGTVIEAMEKCYKKTLLMIDSK